MSGCAAPTSGFISSMTGTIDCQAQMLGSGAWQVLATPGSSLLTLLTGFLTIFIALIGYNLLFGTTMTVRSATVSFVKIGAVFALATSWPAYRTLVYDLILDGPSQLVAEIGPRAGVAGSDGTLLQRLDQTDQALAELSVLGPGFAPQRDVRAPPPPFVGFDAFALGGARILFLLTAIGGMGTLRIIAGLTLALGPFFIAFLLFDSTRSLFEGWVRVLGGAALASFGVSVALGLELAVMEPWLGDVLARRMAGEALPTVSTELFVITCLFSIVVLAAFYACARLVGAFRLAPLLRVLPIRAESRQTAERQVFPVNERGQEGSAAQRTRATALAGLVAAPDRRERGQLAFEVASVGSATMRAGPSAQSSDAGRAEPVGRSFTRRSASRVSARATRRDAGA
jgi:type IV secretion system protein VirB6